jgi:triacylglycerol lipase
MRRTPLAIAVVAAALLAAPGAAQANDPILFVHGWSSSASTWDTMIGRFQADGWTSAELRAFSYDTSQSNATTAGVVAAQVDDLRAATGAATVDIVTHSMGGLSSRYYLKNLGGTSFVDEWVSLGGPNHGTNTAFFCWQTSCEEMQPGSAFLNALNSGDETPGAVNYGTWWSPCDEVINPDESVILNGATNTQTACIGHSELRTDATVYGQVRDYVR